MEQDKAYLLWLTEVKKIADHFKISPENLLKMLYVTNISYDYRQLYNWQERFVFYNKFLKGNDND